MNTGTASSAVGLVTLLGSTSTTTWPDDLWTGSVSWVDALLRYHYGIYEFTDDPNCVLRVALGPTRIAASLSDGTRVEVGEIVGTLHFWNEHLPRYSAKGPDLGWACLVRDRVTNSLRAFSDYIEHEPTWRQVRAIRAETALPARLGAPQIARVFQRYGFEWFQTEPSLLLGRLHWLGECCILWGITRAFNPAAMPRHRFLRDRCELWISRAALRARYADRKDEGGGRELGVREPECSL